MGFCTNVHRRDWYSLCFWNISNCYQTELIAFLDEFRQFEGIKCAILLSLSHLFGIGKNTNRLLEKNGSIENFDIGLIWILRQGKDFR